MNSSKMLSKITGIGYLLIFLTGFYANFFVLEKLMIPEDAAATTANIVTHGALFRTGILSFIVMVLVDLLLAWTLYILLKPVNKHLSLLTAWFRLVNATIFGIALFHLFNILQLLNNEKYPGLIETRPLQAHAMLLLDSFNHTWLIGLIFFGIHLFLLGYLILKSNDIPGILGILLIVASAGYLTDSFAYFLFPGYHNYKDIFMMVVAIPGVVGELSFTVWLLVRGVKNKT